MIELNMKFKGYWGNKPHKLFKVSWQEGDTHLNVRHRSVEVSFDAFQASTLEEALKQFKHVQEEYSKPE